MMDVQIRKPELVPMPPPPAVVGEEPVVPKSAFVTRFDNYARISHAALMTSFLILAGTGLPLLFSHQKWAYYLSRLWGGFAAAGIIHRIFAVILLVTFAIHVLKVAYRVIVKRDWGMLWGPRSMVPQLSDAREIWQHMKWFVGLGKRPNFDHWAYWEKFDYWAVFWGMFMIGGSGLVLWFPAFFAHILPGWMLNICEVIHGEEALMAVCFIFTVHFFNTHLRPGKFPMDLVMFTGVMPRHELHEDRATELARLEAAGKVAELDAPAPTPELVLVSRIVGFVGVGFGLFLIALILYAVVFR